MSSIQQKLHAALKVAFTNARQGALSGHQRVGAHDRIRINGSNVILSYRGNDVASYNVERNILTLDVCGWPTPTTKRRFEVLCSLFVLPAPRILDGSLRIGDYSASRFVFDFSRLESARSAPLSSTASPLSPSPLSSMPSTSSPPPLKLNDKFFLPPETDLFS